MPDGPFMTNPQFMADEMIHDRASPIRTTATACCGDGNCNDVSRRTFIGLLGTGAAAAASARAYAGPFDLAELERLVPADKKLDPAWVESLFARGGPEPVTGPALGHVGMPVGGLFCGTVYLSGDGRLWHWDVFNRQQLGVSRKRPVYEGRPIDAIWGSAYVDPLRVDEDRPLDQGCTLTVKSSRGEATRPLDATGFADVSFLGQYPLGTVRYADPDCPVQVMLEAFSPFAPLETDESSLPVTVLHYDLVNTGSEPVEATLTARLENAAARGLSGSGDLVNTVSRRSDATLIAMSLAPPPPSDRPDIVFEDWSKDGYEGWAVEGSAFGAGPVAKADVPGYQGDVGGDTLRVVNSHATAPGTDVAAKDGGTGKLTSRPFTVARRFIRLWIGGGNHPGQTGVNLLVDGKAVGSVTGHDANQMRPAILDASGLEGREARLEIVDAHGPGWGNVGVGRITFTDTPQAGDVADQPGFGTLCLALVGPEAEGSSGDARLPAAAGTKLVGSLGRRVTLQPGGKASIDVLVAWHFPNVGILGKAKRHYASRFPDAAAVAAHVAENLDRLAARTRLWRDTWYDSTLPWWLLDRTFANTCNLATTVCHRFSDGRLWTWEGVGCCPGTCGHVWHYAQATGRLFPDVERDYRRRVDFAIAQHPDGAIGFRAESGMHPAIDAQAGTILRALREHQMAPDGGFLESVWPGVRKATEWLIAQDGDGDGIIEGPQHNTLDANWFGPVAWLSGLSVSALLAAAEMAAERDEEAFAARCRAIAAAGRKNLVDRLFEGDYFLNRPDPNHPEAINSGTGCHIDQVMGQHWAWQVGLERVTPPRETVSALKSLWRFNFAPDVGPYRRVNKQGRWYAVAGDGGLLMCTFPRADWNYTKAAGKGPDWAAGYFNECMSGFEYQAAAHMIWEGLVMEGLAVTRAVHDRYRAAARNPYNEVECSDHYVRAMASYGVFQAACGFTCHGPQGRFSFAPRLAPADFRAAFVGPEGWGTFTQQVADGRLTASLAVRHGIVAIEALDLVEPAGFAATTVTACHGDAAVAATLMRRPGTVRISCPERLRLRVGERLDVTIGSAPRDAQVP